MINDPPIPSRSIGLWFTIDAGRIDARQRDAELKQLERWRKDGVIDVIISEPSAPGPMKDGRPGMFAGTRRSAGPQRIPTTPAERNELKEIAYALLGRDPQSAAEARDVGILFDAMKRTGSLITEDPDSNSQLSRILRRRAQLRALGIIVCRPDAALAKVRERIRLRDDHAVEWAKKHGGPIPDWVGKD
jgi:hypothetical protein